MSQGFSLGTRLTLWSLMALALLLGGGGFFYYSSQQRQAHDTFDTELLTTARDLARLYNEIGPPITAQADFCQQSIQLSSHSEGKLAVALYSAKGILLCDNHHPLSRTLILSPELKRDSLAGKALFTTATDEKGLSVRILTVPIIRQGHTVLYLQLGSSLLEIEKQQHQLALILVTAVFLGLIGFGVFHWLLIGTLSAPLTRFSRHLDNTTEQNILQHFNFPPPPTGEFEQLAESYNNLADRISQALQRARQFSADVTHELRTPLTILKGETELALRKNKSKEQLLQALSSNLEEISRMSHLIEDLLMLSKSELGEVPLKMEALNLCSMLTDLYGQIQILAEEKQIEVAALGIDEQISLFADGQRLRQVFLNLLANAVKYTPEGGRITIGCQLTGNMVEVTIEDTGIGIDRQHLKHIFDRFYRIDKTRNRNDGGSGLGLAIAKWIVDAHKGSINVRSVPGQGSSFVVTLPLTTLSGGALENCTN